VTRLTRPVEAPHAACAGIRERRITEAPRGAPERASETGAMSARDSDADLDGPGFRRSRSAAPRRNLRTAPLSNQRLRKKERGTPL